MATLISFVVGVVVGIGITAFSIIVAAIIQEDTSAKRKDDK